MENFGRMASLEYLELSHVTPGGLRNLPGVFRAQPFNLKELVILHEANLTMTGEDSIEFLDFLAPHPECKLVEFAGFDPKFDFVSSGNDDERLKNPPRSLIKVLRDKNSTLSYFANTEISAEVAPFWCRMNKTWPNRWQIRRQLNDAYADQIAKYVKGGS